ncbi:unnamed protein product [Xylocopa violacea]|uniref:Uncharacterized protein n=1 Tax=Xylocopa violacea TaxID=135666 RepID=A0ABP1NZ46_XYLVO
MTILRMTSPVTPSSSSPDSNEAQAPQATAKPVHRLSFSVAALLADTKNSDTAGRETSSVSPRSSPVVSYSPVRQEQPSHTSNVAPQKYPGGQDFRSRYLSVSPGIHEHRSTPYTCDTPRSLLDSRTLSRFSEIELDRVVESPKQRSRILDYAVQTSMDSGSTSDAACSSSPKVSTASQPDFGPHSPRSSSHEARSRCSEPEDIDEDDENSLVDVEDLQHQGTSPTPVRPTPAYIGGFSSLGTISGIPAGLHPAVWGGGHQDAAAAAAAAAAATASFFPSHFSHHAPLNGEDLVSKSACEGEADAGSGDREVADVGDQAAPHGSLRFPSRAAGSCEPLPGRDAVSSRSNAASSDLSAPVQGMRATRVAGGTPRPVPRNEKPSRPCKIVSPDRFLETRSGTFAEARGWIVIVWRTARRTLRRCSGSYERNGVQRGETKHSERNRYERYC